MSVAVALKSPPPAGVITLDEPATTVYLSHSSSTLMENCPFAWDLRYNKRLESTTSSVNLGFGGAFDSAATAFVVGHAFGHSLDAVTIFREHYLKWASEHVVDYSSRWKGQQAVVDAGCLLTERFQEWWVASGYAVMLDLSGAPIVQRELRVRLPNNVVYTSILDLLVMTPDGYIADLDIKTPATASTPLFARNSGQLTGQQLCIQAHSEQLGLPSLDKLGFLEAVKRPVPKKKDAEGPVILEPHLVDIRTQAEVDAYVQSRVWIADDIRRKRFCKRPMDAYNSPCGMCSFATLCTEGSMEGLRVRPPRPRR